MKKNLLKILTLAILLGGVLLIPHAAFADNTVVEGFAQSGINGVIAYIANFLLSFTSWFVTVTGIFLSISINLTMHIKDIYSTITGIKTVWIVVRDISSMFIIFFLLYYSILTIVGQGSGKIRGLLLKVFIAGMLINFSLFFVKVAVDASNLVSLQFYRAIAPQTDTNWSVAGAYLDGGLSNVLMNSLRIPTIYNDTSALKTTDIASSIGIAALGGVVIMITAGLSFLGAGIAFIVRTGILLFLMALSPIYFVGIIYPDLEGAVSKPFMKMLKGQLIFMPVYLFLMYVALKLLSDPMFMSVFNQSNVAATANAGQSSALAVAIQYVIAITFVNAPLVVALSLGAVGAKWVPGSGGVMDVNKWLGGKISGVAGRNTVGRLAKATGKSFDNMSANGTFMGSKALFNLGAPIMRKTNISQTVRGGLASAEKGKYGGAYSLKDIDEEDEKRKKEVAEVARTNNQRSDLKTFLDLKGAHTVTQLDAFRKTVGGMDAKELQKIDFDNLEKPEFAASIPQGKFDSLIKELTPTEQQKLKDARETGFKDMLTKHGAEYVLNTALKGKPQDVAKLPTDVLENVEVMRRLDPAALRKMVDENVGKPTRDKIRNEIESQGKMFAVTGKWPAGPLEKTYNYLTSPAGGIF